MNITFNGYLTLTCQRCDKKHSFEGSELQFKQDTSAEAEEDEYIRYITHIDSHCVACANPLQIKLDVWEYPESVGNYSYYDVHGAHHIDCEFHIDHYFDSDNNQDNDDFLENDRKKPDDEKDETDTEDDDEYGYKPSDNDRYVDHYDNDN